MKYCVQCGSPLPVDQGSTTCSMCYGDVDHGKDGYYREYLERAAEEDFRRDTEEWPEEK